MDVFLEGYQSEIGNEPDIPASYEELKPTKSTDINPHILFEHKLDDLVMEDATFKPCKDQFINYLGFQAGYLQLTDLVDIQALTDFEN